METRSKNVLIGTIIVLILLNIIQFFFYKKQQRFYMNINQSKEQNYLIRIIN